MAVPDFVTHYHLADRAPFLNLCDLDDDDLAAVMADLDRLRRSGRQHRPFGRRYMELRRATEARLRAWFVEAGGTPDRTSPHYFVLGESRWYRRLGARMAEVRLPLSALPLDKTSCTYPDSFVAMEPVGPDRPEERHRGRVFRLDELQALVAEVGIPAPTWTTEHRDWRTWPRAAFIEVQLWTDEPLEARNIEPSPPDPNQRDPARPDVSPVSPRGVEPPLDRV